MSILIKLFGKEWYCRTFHIPEPYRKNWWRCKRCGIKYRRRLSDNDTGPM